jgi:hypothetical protein
LVPKTDIDSKNLFSMFPWLNNSGIGSTSHNSSLISFITTPFPNF